MRDRILEYSPSGEPLRTLSVPHGGGRRPPTETLRDLLVASDGRLVVYDGGYAPYLACLDSLGGSWSHATAPGWSSFNRFGGVVEWRGAILVTDMRTGDGGKPSGLVRFDLRGKEGTRILDDVDTRDLAVDPEGRVLALVDEGRVLVLDGDPLERLGSIELEAGCRAIAVDRGGWLLGASLDGRVHRFLPDGTLLGSVDTGVDNLCDLDVDAVGGMVLGSRRGRVLWMDSEGEVVRVVEVGTAPAYVCFVPR